MCVCVCVGSSCPLSVAFEAFRKTIEAACLLAMAKAMQNHTNGDGIRSSNCSVEVEKEEEEDRLQDKLQTVLKFHRPRNSYNCKLVCVCVCGSR